jgi:hypothetical protein
MTDLLILHVIPVSISVVVSWFVIHKRHPILGISAGLGLSFLPLLAYGALIAWQEANANPSTQREWIEGGRMILTVFAIITFTDAVIVFFICISIALAYYVLHRRQDQKLVPPPSHLR